MKKNPQHHYILHARDYRCWTAMKTRCLNPHSKDFPRYGGAGIALCERWKSFQSFWDDMGPSPTLHHQIERINNAGDYEPSNCRWATVSEQARNRRSNMLITHNGETLTAVEWADRLGVERHVVARRIRKGWPPKAAVTTPIMKRTERRRFRVQDLYSNP